MCLIETVLVKLINDSVAEIMCITDVLIFRVVVFKEASFQQLLQLQLRQIAKLFDVEAPHEIQTRSSCVPFSSAYTIIVLSLEAINHRLHYLLNVFVVQINVFTPPV